MLIYSGLKSLSLSIVENRKPVPLPLSGGNTSNEKWREVLLSFMRVLMSMRLFASFVFFKTVRFL